MNIIIKSTITCPACGFATEESMPEDSCLFFYECGNCKAILKPKKAIVVCFVRMEVFPVHQFRTINVVANSSIVNGQTVNIS
jgi:hypothetical protein